VDRRRFLRTVSVSLLAAPLVSEGQTPAKALRVGILWGGRADVLPTFSGALRDQGYVDGQNVIIEPRSAGAESARYNELAAELVGAKVDIILAVSTPAAVAAKRATTTIPIVFAGVGDPIGTGLVTSLARPGGNVTGISQATADGVPGKRLGLLKEAAPKVSRIAVLWVVTNPTHRVGMPLLERAALALGIKVQSLGVRDADDLTDAFTAIRRQRADSLYVWPDNLTFAYLRRIIEFATKNYLPSAYTFREYVDAGGLISYGISFLVAIRAAAVYVAKVLKGARPSDLPVEQAIIFELAINLKTAKALGLTIPPSLLLRADHVIE
jgi:putative ABC transport system substrate-binding protein